MTLPRSVARSRDEVHGSGLFAGGRLLLILLLCASAGLNLFLLQDQRPQAESRVGSEASSGAAVPETLVIYVFRFTDPEALNNLIYFLEHGVKAGDGARYIVAMDAALAEQETPPLPKLPANAEFVRPPSCFEMGVVGWLLYTSGKVNIAEYRHFVWATSLARGPFLPAYELRPWHSLLTTRLSRRTKLVGATISCCPLLASVNQPAMEHPHIQPYVMATDQVGLKLMKKVKALDCHNNWQDNVRFGEYAASAAILNGRFNLDSLMLRYQRVDWLDSDTWGCNAKIDPLQQYSYDGTSVNPLEVLFVRFDFASLTVDLPHVTQAGLYADWTEERKKASKRNVTSNGWIKAAARLKEDVMARPQACFDAEAYQMASPVEFKDFTREQLYEHFVAFGFREGRPYSFFCS